MQYEAAKPKGASRNEDAPRQEPMRGSDSQVRRNPSTDQKKVRRQMAKKASELDAFSVKRGVCQGEGCGVAMAMPDKSNQDLCPNCLGSKMRDVAADQDKSFFDQTKASRKINPYRPDNDAEWENSRDPDGPQYDDKDPQNEDENEERDDSKWKWYRWSSIKTAAKIQWEDMGGFDPAGGDDKLLHKAETEDRDGNVAYGYIHQSAHDPGVIYTTMENDNATDFHDHESVADAKAHVNEHLRGYLPGRKHEDGFTASRKTAGEGDESWRPERCKSWHRGSDQGFPCPDCSNKSGYDDTDRSIMQGLQHENDWQCPECENWNDLGPRGAGGEDCENCGLSYAEYLLHDEEDLRSESSRRTAVVDFEDEDGSFGREGEKNTSAAWAHLLNHHDLTLHEILYQIQQHGKGVDPSGGNRYSAPPADINSDHTDALQDIHEHDHEFGDLVPDHDHTPTDENPILRRGIDTTSSRRTADYERNQYGRRIRGEEEECQDYNHIGATPTPWGTFNPCIDCYIENQTEQEREYDRRYPYRGGPDEYPRPTTASRKTATQFETRADKLNPGQHIRTPTGGTTQVRRVRNHESSGKHVYVDTDLGTTVVPREDAFEVVPQNARQQESPGYGTPGGNSNTLPFDPHGPGGSNTSTSATCPVCGRKGSFRRSGDHYECLCGYQETFGGTSDKNYSSSTQVIRTFTNKNNNRRTASVIAQRARQVLDLEENQ